MFHFGLNYMVCLIQNGLIFELLKILKNNSFQLDPKQFFSLFLGTTNELKNPLFAQLYLQVAREKGAGFIEIQTGYHETLSNF